MCSPRDKERFYLRTLLIQVSGATSYESVRTIDGIIYDTYEKAVRQLGLLDKENDEFDKCLKEAVSYQMPSKLRQLFATILLFCDPREFNACKLLNHLNNLNEDYLFHKQQQLNESNLSDNDHAIITAKTLADIEKYLIPYGKTLSDFSIMSPDYSLIDNFVQTDLIAEETNYDVDKLQEILSKEDSLNVDQKAIYSTIIEAINNETNQTVFFIDGPGGYGKTFLFNMILAKVRSNHKFAIAVASSGIAALLLDGGRTAHSRFKIPIPLTESSLLDISNQSELAKLIRLTNLIIWDKAPMTHRFAFEAVDRTFRDITGIEKPFGGIIFVMGGDFRQILPVVIRGTRGHIVNAC
jgi:ATP-dependent DNA helicase PIF1